MYGNVFRSDPFINQDMASITVASFSVEGVHLLCEWAVGLLGGNCLYLWIAHRLHIGASSGFAPFLSNLVPLSESR